MKIKNTWVKNSLGYDNNIYIYQDKKMFNYSVDTILLANLTSLNRKTKRILEIGTNNCALSIFLSQRSKNIKIDAIEIQKEAIELAKYNIEMNKLENRINLIHNDFNNWWKIYTKNQGKKYDVIICNPPFYRKETKIKKNISKSLLQATHEISLTIDQIIEGSSKIINQKGYLSMIIPPERLVDCFVSLRKYCFEPKRIIMIHPRVKQKAILAFVEARFQTGWGTHFEPNLYLHPDDESKHEYLEEIIRLYKPIKIK
ncbi:tRNA1(Val) (adenine(37)-N6)-methyltransferase [Mesomycoplasma moatsii]|uniref:tRNA1(Val) (adenine(37)-N6)-methyltransferase n=1 Tax=Mesomycoplasma moatsii TaxID=171287 RepID=UPI0003B66082